MKKKKLPHKKNKLPEIEQPVRKKMVESGRSGRDIAAYLILLILSFLIYSNTLFFDYTLDDRMVITDNQFTQTGIKGIGDIMTNDAFTGFFGKQKKLVAGGRYRPLSQLMFAVEKDMFGNKPLAGHLINVLLYMLTALMLYRTLKILFHEIKSFSWYLSIPFIATIFFVVHPVHTEVIANIKGRDEILSFLCAILSLYFALIYIDSKKRIFLILSGAAIFLGLLAKENAITFIAVVPLSYYMFRKPSAKEYIIILIPMVLAFIIYLVLRKNALGYLISPEKVTEILNNPYANSTSGEKYATIFFTWLIYIKLLIFPHPLTHDYYPFHIAITNFTDLRVLLSLVIFVVLGVYALLKLRSKHILAFSILYFFITFSISSNLVFNLGTFMNERFIYTPSLGFTLVLGYLFSVTFKEIIKNRKKFHSLASTILIIICIAGSAETFSRNYTWKDDYTLFTTDVKTSSNSAKCNVSAGEAILRKAQEIGNQEQQKKYYELASKYLSKAVMIYPGSLGGWHLNGTALTNLGRNSEALICYRNGLKLSPDEKKQQIILNELDLMAHNSYVKKDYTTAEEAFGLLLRYRPGNVEYQIILADIIASVNRIDEGINKLEEIIKNYPENFLAFNKLGRIYGEKLNDLMKSLYYLTKAYELNKEDPSTLTNLGIVYAMLRNYERSVFFFRSALEKNPGDPLILTNLANTYMTMGETEKAEACFREARRN